MGWIADGTYNHEGWVSLVLRDGRVALGTSRNGVLVEYRPEDNSAEKIADGWSIQGNPSTPNAYARTSAPWSEVELWRVACICGWTGGEQAAIHTERGRADPPEQVEDEVFLPQWRAHVACAIAIESLNESAAEFWVVQRQLRAKVALALSAGVDWEQITRQLGIGANPSWETVRVQLGLPVGTTRQEFEATAAASTESSGEAG